MKVLVVIPCRNEKLAIESCIDAIYQSELKEGVEISVAVVDGLSDDGTLEVLEKIKIRYPNVHLIVNEKKLTPFAFNLGIKSQEADFYQIVGARQIISPNYIQGAIDKMLQNPEIWCVGGKVENTYANKTAEIISKAMSSSFGMGMGNFRVKSEDAFVDTVGTPMYPKRVFEKIGYFDETLVRNQDDEFNFRVIQAEGKVLLDASITIKYQVRAQVNGLWRQFFQYGYWKVYVNKKHKTITTLRQLIPPLFVIYLSFWIITLLLPSGVLVLFSFPLVFYFLLALKSAANLSHNPGEITQISGIFPILHLSYGLGYLKGILDFYIQGKKPDEKQTRLSR